MVRRSRRRPPGASGALLLELDLTAPVQQDGEPGGHRHRVRRRGPRRSGTAHRPGNGRRDRSPYRPGLDRGLRRLRAGLRLHGGGEPGAGSAAPQLAAHRRPRRIGGAGRQLFGRVPAQVPGRLAADRPHRGQHVGPRPGPSPRWPAPATGSSSAPSAMWSPWRRSRSVRARQLPRTVPAQEPASGLRIVSPGLQSLIQDLGRHGHSAPGRLRRRCAGPGLAAPGQPPGRATPPSAAAIETVAGGLTVQAVGDQVLAVAGAPSALTVDSPSDAGPTQTRTSPHASAPFRWPPRSPCSTAKP